jgi:poly(beta-D-mannuronate) lyase
MNRDCRSFILLLVLLGAARAIYATNTGLRSPWDAHSVALTDAPYSCPTAPALPHDFATNSYYIDNHHSIPDPALKKKYEDSVAGIEGFSHDVVKAADAFQTSGSRAAAVCTASLLETATNQRTLTGHMDGHQASYVQGWNLGAWAVAFLKTRGSGALTEEQQKQITGWLKKLAEENRAYYERKREHHGPSDAHNNHLYWAGFAIAAAAIAGNDRSLFRWAVDAYKEGVGDIGADGTLPMEMDRGQMALHYHLYALAPLIMLAEFGEANGLDLYAESNYAIKRLIALCVAGLNDPDFFRQRTGVPQVTDSEIQAWQISWAKPYTRRFPDPKLSDLLTKPSYLNYTMLGGLPPP